MKMLSRIAATTAAFSILVLSGCGKKEAPPPPPPPVAAAPTPAPAPVPDLVNVPVAVKQVQLANQIDAAKKAVAPGNSFAAKDTIYAVVDTVGSGKASLKARWTFHKGDKSAAVSETVQELTLAGPASSEFHISKPDGWPVGDYQVEVLLNDQPVGSHKFTVK